MKGLWKAAALLVIGSTAATQTQRSGGMEAEDVRVAELAILGQLSVGSAPKARSLCSREPVACIGGDRVELAMSVIAARKSPRSLRALAGLYRYRLDGAYAELLDEYVCEAGRPIEKYLAALQPDQLHDQCSRDFAAFVAANPVDLEGAKVEDVCREAPLIRSELKQSLQMVRHPPKSCQP